MLYYEFTNWETESYENTHYLGVIISSNFILSDEKRVRYYKDSKHCNTLFSNDVILYDKIYYDAINNLELAYSTYENPDIEKKIDRSGVIATNVRNLNLSDVVMATDDSAHPTSDTNINCSDCVKAIEIKLQAQNKDFLIARVEESLSKSIHWYMLSKCGYRMYIRTLYDSERALMDYYICKKNFVTSKDFIYVYDALHDYVENFSIEKVIDSVKVENIEIFRSRPGKDDYYYIDKIVYNGCDDDSYIDSIVPNSRKEIYRSSGFTDCYNLAIEAKKYLNIGIGRIEKEENEVKKKLKQTYNKKGHFVFLLYKKLTTFLPNLDNYAKVRSNYWKYWNINDLHWYYKNFFVVGATCKDPPQQLLAIEERVRREKENSLF